MERSKGAVGCQEKDRIPGQEEAMSLPRVGRLLYNILPYCVVKKIILKWNGDGSYIKFRNSTAEFVGQAHEIDFGEFIFISDKSEILKKKAKLEHALRITQEKLDEMEARP
jgi:hypothetical protein